MLGAARAAARFHCPGCGAGLRAPRSAAGTAVECFVCGEPVRVPRRPHPLEGDADDAPLVPPAAAAAVAAGIGLLRRSLGLTVAGYVAVGGAVSLWVAVAGPAAVFAREPGGLWPVLSAVAAADLLAALAAASLRWIGYRRCEPAAVAVQAGRWVALARAGVAVRAIGYALAAVPWVGGLPVNDTPDVVAALAQAGLLAAVVGAALEFGVLPLWSRLLAEGGGADAARRVTGYAVTAGVAVVATANAVCLAGMMTVLALRRDGPPPPPLPSPPRRLNFAAVPDDGWYAVLAVAAVAAGFGAVLCVRYARILAAVRAGLAGGPR